MRTSRRATTLCTNGICGGDFVMDGMLFVQDEQDVRDAPGWRQEGNVRCHLSVSRLLLLSSCQVVSPGDPNRAELAGFCQ